MQYSTNPYLAVAQLMENSYWNTMNNARGYEDFGQAFKRQHGFNNNAEMLRYILERAQQQYQNALPEREKYINPYYNQAIENMTTSERLNFDRNLRGQ